MEAFREQIAKDMVPIVARVKEDQRKRLGLDHLRFYDDVMLFADGNAKPAGSSDEILKAGREMYHGLSPETAEFVDFLYDNELLDVLSKDGKAPGGYCTDIPGYKAPFIFSNFNGTLRRRGRFDPRGRPRLRRLPRLQKRAARQAAQPPPWRAASATPCPWSF